MCTYISLPIDSRLLTVLSLCVGVIGKEKEKKTMDGLELYSIHAYIEVVSVSEQLEPTYNPLYYSICLLSSSQLERYMCKEKKYDSIHNFILSIL